MKRIIIFLFIVIIFFGIVSCPSPDSSVTKESLLIPVATIDGSSTGNQPLATPEPATLFLLGAGLVGLAVIGRNKIEK